MQKFYDSKSRVQKVGRYNQSLNPQYYKLVKGIKGRIPQRWGVLTFVVDILGMVAATP